MPMIPAPSRVASSLFAFAAAATFALAATPAHAQEAPPPSPPDDAPHEAPPVAAPPAVDAKVDDDAARPRENPRDVRFTDANADRVVLGSTAETHPKGTFFVSDYEILLVQLGYAVTDDLQISVAGIPPIAKSQPYFFDFGLKLNVVRNETFRAAFTGALDVATATGDAYSSTYYGGRLGAIGQFCFEATCRSSVSFNAGTFLSSASSSVLPVYGSAGFIANVSPLVSLLAEPAIFGVVGAGDVHASSGAVFLANYGVRLSEKNFGLDLTMVKPIVTTNGSSDDTFVMGYPFLAFTYRTDGAPRSSATSTFANAAAMSPRGF